MVKQTAAYVVPFDKLKAAAGSREAVLLATVVEECDELLGEADTNRDDEQTRTCGEAPAWRRNDRGGASSHSAFEAEGLFNFTHHPLRRSGKSEDRFLIRGSAAEGLLVGIAKKGTRSICVEDVMYRWLARELSPGLRIVVQAAELPGAVLVHRTNQNIVAAHVPPSQVAAAIQSARAAGWEPQHPGAPFEVNVSL